MIGIRNRCENGSLSISLEDFYSILIFIKIFCPYKEYLKLEYLIIYGQWSVFKIRFQGSVFKDLFSRIRFQGSVFKDPLWKRILVHISLNITLTCFIRINRSPSPRGTNTFNLLWKIYINLKNIDKEKILLNFNKSIINPIIINQKQNQIMSI